MHSMWFSLIYFTSGSESRNFSFLSKSFSQQLCWGSQFSFLKVLLFTQAISHIFCTCLHFNPNYLKLMINFWQVLTIGLYNFNDNIHVKLDWSKLSVFAFQSNPVLVCWQAGFSFQNFYCYSAYVLCLFVFELHENSYYHYFIK